MGVELGRGVAADPRLGVLLQCGKDSGHRRAVGQDHAFITARKVGEGNGFRCGV